MDKNERKHRSNLSAYEREIDRLYRQAVAQAAAIGASLQGPKGDALFSFDDYPTVRKRVERLLEALQSGITAVVTDGIKAEWELANEKNSELVRQVFGDNAGKLAQEQYRRYFNNNDDAREAFEKRKVNGLGLSDRVWQYTDQFKEEIELGLDVGIRNGMSADEMSRELRQYLKYPDKLFRRVRDEHGKLQLSKRAAAFHPGRGVYRSSYKNARRLAATETNIAYRTADHERRQQFDFVVGIEIKLSKNHPEADICDDLKGRYPKDFKFTGWHPQCRCYTTGILKTKEELAEDTRRILAGEELDGNSVNRVEDVPENFKQWIKGNESRYKAAEKRGTLPYFIKDNKKVVDGILNAAKAYYAPKGVDNAIRHLWEGNTSAIEKKLGIARGKDMSFEEANELRGNPNYGKGGEYSVNCQSCVVANELRRRGFDVEAFGKINQEQTMIARDATLAWIDPQSGLKSVRQYAGFDSKKGKITKAAQISDIQSMTKEKGRYTIGVTWTRGRGAHIINVERLDDGNLIFYDPQCGKKYTWEEWISEVYPDVSKSRYIRVQRIDNLLVNTSIINKIVTESKP